jgi:hypothetical protein
VLTSAGKLMKYSPSGVDAPHQKSLGLRHGGALGFYWLLTQEAKIFELAFQHKQAIQESPAKSHNVKSYMMSRGALAAQLAFIDVLSRYNREEELSQRRAIFDVEGNVEGKCLVLTPFQMMLESVPRAEQRAMSVSWVLEQSAQSLGKEDTEQDGKASSRGEKSFYVRDMVRGMWRYSLLPSGWYNLI